MATKKKKTTTLRVHTLAKELGVSSKDIIAKCVAEDIPDITNHMSAVSVGLSHTVREWFSVAAEVSSTAVETAAKVDVVKARAKAKKATKKVVKVQLTTKHFRNVYKTFNAVFDFNEAAVIGKIRNLTRDLSTFWVT